VVCERGVLFSSFYASCRVVPDVSKYGSFNNHLRQSTGDLPAKVGHAGTLSRFGQPLVGPPRHLLSLVVLQVGTCPDP
jgi:hypothetical protein